MSVCPFCKAQVGTSSGPCPKCGRVASDHPSMAMAGGRNLGGDFDDDLGTPDLVLETGSSVGKVSASQAKQHAQPETSSYAGGAGGMFDDDDVLQDNSTAGLELDMPSQPPSSRSAPQPPAKPSGQHGAVRPSGQAHAAPPAPTSSQRGMSAAAHSSGSLPAAPHSSGSLPAGPPSSGSLPASEGASGQVAAAPPPLKVVPPPDPAALVVAKYPPPPTAVWQAPVYACKVLWRQFELRQDLESLRRRRSPDVGLYERALRAHDKKAFALGLAIVIAAMTLAAFVFMLPVIIRFVRAPD